MRKYLIFAVVALPTFLGHVSSTAVAVAFPTMVSHFQTSLVLAGWVVGIYPLVMIAAIPVTSRLSDTVGRRSTFMLCLIFFTVGSFLCAIAPNMGWLIFFRVVQAIGGGGFTSAAVGIVSDEYPDTRQQMIGLLSSTNNFGAVVGPNMAGAMVQYLGWQSVFWANIPIGVIGLVMCRYFIKADVKKSYHGNVDFVGVGLLAGFASAIMISLTLMGKDYHVPAVMAALVALLGILLLVMFVYRSARSSGGIISMKMLANRPFLAANVFNFVFGSCTQSGIMTFMPFYATSVYGMSVLESGSMITPRSLGIIVTSIIASFSLMKWGYRRPLLLGTLTTVLGLVLLAMEPHSFNLAGINVTSVVLVLAFGLIIGVGAGLINPASNNACIELMPENAAGITGLRQIARQLGGAIGIGVCTLVLESNSSMARGFTLLLLGFSAAQLLSIILVFYMPASPVVRQPHPTKPIRAPEKSPSV